MRVADGVPLPREYSAGVAALRPHAGGRRVPRRVFMTADAVGGVWTYARDLSTALAAHGIEVTLAVMGPPPPEAELESARAGGIRAEARPFRLEWMDDPWDDIEAAGCWLLEIADRVRPDIVHLNGYCHAGLPWSVPAIVVAHSCVCSWWRAVHRVAAPVVWSRYHDEVRRGLDAASLVVAPSRAMLECVRREYGHVPSARVIANGRPQRACAGTQKDSCVLAAGRVWDRAKNIEALCAIAPALSWPVFIAGDAGTDGSGAMGHGPWEGSRRGHTDATFLGRLDGAAMQTWHERAAIYALPARYEPFGLSVLEAAMAGCALVLGDIPSLRENWSAAAVFVQPDDADALRSAIEDLIENPSARRRLAAQAQLRSQRFTIERTADAYVDVYATAIGASTETAFASTALPAERERI